MDRGPLARKYMFMLVGGLVAAPSLCGCYRAKPAEINRPKVAVERLSRDFGTVRAGPILRTNFWVRNAGRRRLVLNARSADCGCTASRQPTIMINPGDCYRIDASLDTNTISGPVAMDLTYSTNDVSSPTLTFTLLVDVVQPVSKQSNLPFE